MKMKWDREKRRIGSNIPASSVLLNVLRSRDHGAQCKIRRRQQRRRRMKAVEKKANVCGSISAFDPIECLYALLATVFIGFLYTGALLFNAKSTCSYARTHTHRCLVLVCNERGLANFGAGLSITYTRANATVTIERWILSLCCGRAVLSSCSYQSDFMYLPHTVPAHIAIIELFQWQRAKREKPHSARERALTRREAFDEPSVVIACWHKHICRWNFQQCEKKTPWREHYGFSSFDIFFCSLSPFA